MLGTEETYSFLHWPLEFPDVTRAGGFDVVLTNPPWELLQPEETGFFRTHGRNDIAQLPGAQRKAAIRDLPRTDPNLARRWEEHKLAIARQTGYIRKSGRFPLTSVGKLNVYAPFMETVRSLLKSTGRAGCIVPSGLVTDDTTKKFFQTVIEKRELVSLYHFTNRAKLFPDVGSNVGFCLLTLAGSDGTPSRPDFSFFLQRAADLRHEERRLSLDEHDIRLLNPNTRTCPIIPSRRDVRLLREIYRRVPILVEEGRSEGNPWGIQFRQGLFNMTSKSHLFRGREELRNDGWCLQEDVFHRDRDRYLPLFEAKMFHHFNHRWRTLGGSRGATCAAGRELAEDVFPRYWVTEAEVESQLQRHWDWNWVIGCRLICRNTDERTIIASILPRVGCGNSVLVLFPSGAGAVHHGLLTACLSSYALDYVARRKLGGINLNFHILKQLPVLPPSTYDGPAPWYRDVPLRDWLAPRLLELTYTSPDLVPFARDMGYAGNPFGWDSERRFLLRCELDAAFFHLYGIAHDDVGFIMDTFPIVRHKDEKALGEYRTKRVIMELYDAMQTATVNGSRYKSAAASLHQG